jgi:hypothetical protein
MITCFGGVGAIECRMTLALECKGKQEEEEHVLCSIDISIYDFIALWTMEKR